MIKPLRACFSSVTNSRKLDIGTSAHSIKPMSAIAGQLATATVTAVAAASASAQASDDDSMYGFVLNKPANLAALILYALLWAFHTGFGLWYRQWWLLVSWFIGLGLECAGYVGRYQSCTDPNNLNDFLVQICCLTLGPAFIMGGVYYQLGKVVVIISQDVSLVKPMMYTAIFTICDLVSIILQAIGGGMAAMAFQDNNSTDSGTHIMVAGMAWQVFSMSVFAIMAFGTFWETWKAVKRHEGEFAHNPEFDPRYAHIRANKLFLWFCFMIFWVTLCVYIRSIYRIIELAQGWRGYLILHEQYFLVLDGLFVFLGCLGFTVVHPGFVFGKEIIAVEGLHRKARGSELKSIAGSEGQQPYTIDEEA